MTKTHQNDLFDIRQFCDNTRNPPAAQLSPNNNAALKQLERQIAGAEQDVRDDGDTPPTQRAINTAFCLLHAACQSSADLLPENGVLYGDGNGGLRLEWAHQNRQVRLVFHQSDPAQAYLYHQENNRYAIETNVSPSHLSGWLRWLTEVIK